MCIGPGLRGHIQEMSERIHHYYTSIRTAPVECVPAAGFPQGTWTFVDAVVLPGTWFKKYDFHEADLLLLRIDSSMHTGEERGHVNAVSLK